MTKKEKKRACGCGCGCGFYIDEDGLKTWGICSEHIVMKGRRIDFEKCFKKYSKCDV